MAATEKNITTVSTTSTTPSSLSGYFTMSNGSGAPSRLDASVFNNVVMGTGTNSSGIKIWVGSTLPSSREANTLYFVTD